MTGAQKPALPVYRFDASRRSGCSFAQRVQATRDLPHLRISREPRISALFSRTRNDVEAPQHLARFRIVGDDVARDIHRPLFVDGSARKVRRGARVHRDRRDQDVAHNRRRRGIRHAAFTRQTWPLVPPQVFRQIHDAVLAEARHLPSGLRIERDEHVAVHHDKDPLVAARHPSSR